MVDTSMVAMFRPTIALPAAANLIASSCEGLEVLKDRSFADVYPMRADGVCQGLQDKSPRGQYTLARNLCVLPMLYSKQNFLPLQPPIPGGKGLHDLNTCFCVLNIPNTISVSCNEGNCGMQPHMSAELPSVNTSHRVLIVQCYRLPA